MLDVFRDWVDPVNSVLEIGCGDGRNVDYLNENGYLAVGIDKNLGTAIEDVPEDKYDVIYTMSCLFLIPPEKDWVFPKIARMARKYIITIEGEAGDGHKLWARDYAIMFPGFEQVYYQNNVFNEYGVLRVLKNVNIPNNSKT